MRIALICTEKLPVPPVAGGAVQLYIEGIVPYLSKHHDVTVFSIEYPGLPSEELKDNVRYIRIPSSTKAGYRTDIKSRLQDGFDLVYVFNRPLWVLSLSRGLPGVRFGLSLHNEMFHPEKISDSEAVECINRVDFINTVSRFIADGVEYRVPEAQKKLKVVYSGVDTDKYFPAWSHEGIQNKLRLKEYYRIPGYRVVLFVGRLSRKKGVDVLLKAMSKVMDTYRDVALVIIGSKWYGKNESDEYTALLQNLAGKLRGPIIFTGFLPPSQIPAHYNLADVFVCPSQWNEPLARVHYEAMAAGLPIITTDRGGNSEVVEKGKNGLILSDHDSYKNCSSPDSLAEYIMFLLDNPDIASGMGMEGRKLAEGKYNWKRVADDILDSISRCAQPASQTVSIKSEEPINVPPKKEIRQAAQNPDDFFNFDF